MKKIRSRHRKVFSLIILSFSYLAFTQNISAQTISSEDLSAKLEKRDSLLFNAAFNTCNMKEVESVLAKNFVFYHDEGLGAHTTSQSHKDFVESIQKNFCENKNMKMRREFVKGSSQVFLTDDNNAIQTGTQRFYILVQGESDKIVEESKFSRDWKKIDGDWKLAKELDYAVNTKFNTENTTALYKEIAHMDSVLFDAFNAHDVEKLKTLFTEDLEFYHDKGGLTRYEQNMNSFKENFARASDIHRELIAGSMEVYPIKDYGAVEIAAHRFCHLENGKDVCGTFKFVHVWQKKDGNWKISRVVSYDH